MDPEKKETDINSDDILNDDDDLNVDLEDVKLEDIEAIVKDDEPPKTFKPLPDGFDLAEYGLTGNDETLKLQGDLQKANDAAATAESRMQDTQRSFHDNQTQLAQIQQQMLQQQSQPQPIASPNSQQLLQQYNQQVQSNDPNAVNTGNAYQQALVNEQMQPKFDVLQQQIQQSMASMQVIAERSAFFQSPENRDIDMAEMERSFNVQTGGSGGSIQEQAFLFRARKAGGISDYIALLKREGADKLVAQLRKGNPNKVKTVAHSGTQPHQSSNSEGSEGFVPPDSWTDERYLEYLRKRKDEGYDF